MKHLQQNYVFVFEGDGQRYNVVAPSRILAEDEMKRRQRARPATLPKNMRLTACWYNGSLMWHVDDKGARR